MKLGTATRVSSSALFSSHIIVDNVKESANSSLPVIPIIYHH